MTQEQFATWLFGYLQVNVFQRYSNMGTCANAADVQKVGDEVLAAARCVPTSGAKHE